VYADGLFALFVHQFMLYVIVYTVGTHASPLNSYHISQLHLAYKFAGAVLHIVTEAVRAAFEYHHSNLECTLFGVQSDLTLFHSTNIIAHVHPFGWIVIEG
jgi:hypothetical protein